MTPSDLRAISPKQIEATYSPAHVASGISIPKQSRVEQFSPAEWEQFTEEWAASLTTKYFRVARFAGAGDKGLDVVGFVNADSFDQGWENYQCKHYASPLRPSDIWVEIGKIIYYSYHKEYPPPSKYYFVAPKNVGIKLQRLLANKPQLKLEAEQNWDACCKDGITAVEAIELKDDFLTYFRNFDFDIFSTVSVADLITGHAKTPFHTVRFGGGFPARPLVEPVPATISPSESRYVRHLLDAYADHLKENIDDVNWLNDKQGLKRDFLRQRERFYHAESLRNFSRDIVPDGTFERLQQEVYQGIVDVVESSFVDGLERMRATLSQSANLALTSNPLCLVVEVQDKQGICHQLTNADQFNWIKRDEPASPSDPV